MSEKQKYMNSSNILYVTLIMIPQILQVSKNYYRNYKNSLFKYFSFVARFQKKLEVNYIFNDQTATFAYTPKLKQNFSHLQLKNYYQCLCILKSSDKFVKIEIQNIKQVDGNAITNHMIRVITGEISRKIIQIKEPEHVQDSGQVSKIDQLYLEMKDWTIKKRKFTLEELKEAFTKYKQEEFNYALQKMEDEQIIGNMGEIYEYL